MPATRTAPSTSVSYNPSDSDLNATDVQNAISEVNQNYGRREAVIDIVDCTQAPPTEVNGDRYIIDNTAGTVHPDWDGASKNDIVNFDGTEWKKYSPKEGDVCFIDYYDVDYEFIDDGTPQWQTRGSSSIVHNNTSGKQGGTTDEYFHLTQTQHTSATREASTSQNGLISQTDWNTFNDKEDSITAGTTAQYWRGDKSWQTLDKSAVGLSNVDNTSDINKPISTATQTALDDKADKVSGATVGNFAGLDASGNLTDSGSKSSDFEPTFSKNTAFNKNFGSTTDTVCEGDDSRLSDARTPTAHNLAGAEHNVDTLANLNSKISDATLIDTADSRLSDSRTCNNTFDNASTSRTNLDVYSTGEVDALVSAAIILQGDWNANTNTPDITTTTTTGYAWRVSVAGATDLGGITDWQIGDLAVKTATGWLKIDNEDIAAVWGNISGTLSNQTDLQDALNAKEPTLTKGNLTESTSDVLTITGGTGAIIGSGLTIEVDQADTLNDGYLSSTDWNTFNNKANSGANTDITSLRNTSLSVGRDADNFIDWATDNQLDIRINAITHSIASISTGTSNNDKLATQGYIDDAVASYDTWDEVMHNGNTFTVLDTENLSAIITQNDITNNPAALIINNTGTGNDITLPNASYIKNGVVDVSGTYKISNIDVLTSTTLGSGVINASLTNINQDTDTTINIGRASFASPVTDVMYLSHFDRKGEATNYALKQAQDGTTCLNSRTTKSLNFCISNGTKASIDPNGNMILNFDLGLTASRVNKGWFDDIESTNMPTVSGTSINANGVLSLTSAEVSQLANIGTSTISVAQWGYLGNMDQNVAKTSSVEFSSILTGSITTDDITLSFGATVGTIETSISALSDDTQLATAKGIWDSINGNGILDLTSAEITQLANINTTTISATQWGYVGGANQPTKTTDNVIFNRVKLNDGNRLLMGTTDDASIRYDGTDLLIDPRESGSGNLLVIGNADLGKTASRVNKGWFTDLEITNTPTINGKSIKLKNITTVNSATYDLVSSDEILHVIYTTTGAVSSLTLPTAQMVSGRIVIIKDAGGNSGTYSITIDTEGAEKIDGQDTVVINNNYDSVSLYCDGSNWFII